VFAGNRKELGIAIYGKMLQRPTKASALAVIDYMGYEEEFNDIICELKMEVENFKEKYNVFKDKLIWSGTMIN